MSRRTTPVEVIRFKRDGDRYRLRFDVKGKACRYWATEYGVRRVIAHHGATFENVSAGGWYTYRVAAPKLRGRVARFCEDCGARLPDESPMSRRYCGNACSLRASRRRRKGR